eukprot:comp22499_c1_seq1/m.34002 comp22499_c1_seq1/g.34002  ORF comp22499_c1_seq1/g.34002 comp22499_c1_seq1/m.34002 type:complete len:618 (-) comp22499_c1_seq1:738-2591(-)
MAIVRDPSIMSLGGKAGAATLEKNSSHVSLTTGEISANANTAQNAQVLNQGNPQNESLPPVAPPAAAASLERGSFSSVNSMPTFGSLFNRFRNSASTLSLRSNAVANPEPLPPSSPETQSLASQDSFSTQQNPATAVEEKPTDSKTETAPGKAERKRGSFERPGSDAEKFASRFKGLQDAGETITAHSPAVMNCFKVRLGTPLLGRFYVTTKHLCFYSSVDITGSVRVQVPVTDIAKVSINGMGGLSVRTEADEKYSFVVMYSAARDALVELWESEKGGKLASDSAGEEEGECTNKEVATGVASEMTTVPCGCASHLKTELYSGVVMLPPEKVFAALHPTNGDDTTVWDKIVLDRKMTEINISEWAAAGETSGGAENTGGSSVGVGGTGKKTRQLTFHKALPPNPFGASSVYVEETQTLVTEGPTKVYVVDSSSYTPNTKVANSFKVHMRVCVSRQEPTAPSTHAWAKLHITADIEYVKKLFGPIESLVTRSTIAELAVNTDNLAKRVHEYASTQTGSVGGNETLPNMAGVGMPESEGGNGGALKEAANVGVVGVGHVGGGGSWSLAELRFENVVVGLLVVMVVLLWLQLRAVNQQNDMLVQALGDIAKRLDRMGMA